MEIDYKFAVRTFFPTSSFVQVYYEGVANSLDAGADEVSIYIKFDGHIHEPTQLEVTITDNGDGFTDERFERFRRLQEPQDGFHKGVGRLVYLQYFAAVDVVSRFDKHERRFSFAGNFDGSSATTLLPDGSALHTTLAFKDFLGSRLHTYDDIKPGALKYRLLEQFLPELHERKTAQKPFTISIELEPGLEKRQYELLPSREVLTLADVPDLEVKDVEFSAGGRSYPITIRYLIQTDDVRPKCITAACVDGRSVSLKVMSASALPDATSGVFLFRSELFTGSSDSARQRLVLPEDVKLPELICFLQSQVASILNDSLPSIATRNSDTKLKFEETYPHLIGLFDSPTVGLVDPESTLEAAQAKFFRQQRQVLEGDPTSEATFERSLELSARALAEYILYRDWVIKRLADTAERDLESAVHKLIVPQRVVFEGTNLVDDIYRNNAWLLDDKFMTFRTILSEAKMEDVINAITLGEDGPADEGRPDISMIFSGDPNGDAKVDVVVVELKRRAVDDKEGTYAAIQLIKRARKLVDHCPNIQRAWYYAVIEVNDALAQTLTDDEWIPLYSKGRVFFRERTLSRSQDDSRVSIPMFILSFDAVVHDAQARNHTFLELLKCRFRRQAAAQQAAAASDGELQLAYDDTPDDIEPEA